MSENVPSGDTPIPWWQALIAASGLVRERTVARGGQPDSRGWDGQVDERTLAGRACRRDNVPKNSLEETSMSDTNTITANDRPRRKTLTDQLDRLDGVIDDLSDGLNQAVATAVERGVTTAVQQAVGGLIQAAATNPELMEQLAQTTKSSDAKEAKDEKDRGFFGKILDGTTNALSRVGGVLVPDGPGKGKLRLAAGVGIIALTGVGAWLAAPALIAGAGLLGRRVAGLTVPLLASCK